MIVILILGLVCMGFCVRAMYRDEPAEAVWAWGIGFVLIMYSMTMMYVDIVDRESPPQQTEAATATL